MAISLIDGHIDAYNFKLTGGTSLYMNSNPVGSGPDDCYFKLIHNLPGTEGSQSYLKFTNTGSLDINIEGPGSMLKARHCNLDISSQLATERWINPYYWYCSIRTIYGEDNIYFYDNLAKAVESEICLSIAANLIG
jgi:hypothetical protein